MQQQMGCSTCQMSKQRAAQGMNHGDWSRWNDCSHQSRHTSPRRCNPRRRRRLLKETAKNTEVREGNDDVKKKVEAVDSVSPFKILSIVRMRIELSLN
jgi:hypothetical protein